jgi:hypothetical protein
LYTTAICPPSWSLALIAVIYVPKALDRFACAVELSLFLSVESRAELPTQGR